MMYKDTRHGGVPRLYAYVPKDAYMAVSDEIKHTVCFLCVHHGQGNYTPYATAFFLAVPYEFEADKEHLYTDRRHHFYLVTARHNIDGLPAEHRKRGIHIRYNNDRGKIEHLALPDEWEYPQGTADVAVLPLDELPDSLKVDAVQLNYCLTNETGPCRPTTAEDDALRNLRPVGVDSLGVGIGDEIYIVGLFRHHQGRGRNIPIVRSGIIAADPEELIYDDYANEWYNGYLVEVRSIGGLSGSPVFVNVDNKRVALVGRSVGGGTRTLFLLGLVRGHWSLTDEDDLPNILSPLKSLSRNPKPPPKAWTS